MIKTLRRRFVAISMLAVTLVLAGILAVIDVANYVDVKDTIETRMELLIASSFSENYKPDNDIKPPDGGAQPEQELPPRGDFGGADFGDPVKDRIFKEARFDARYFSVLFDADGNIISSDISQTASVSDERAVELSKAAYGTRGGFVDHFYYTAMESAEDDTPLPDGQLRYIFLDSSRELATFSSYVKASITIGAVGLILFFGLIVFFSKLVLRPVEESYAKQKRFITDASHEIKTPLGIIGANTEVIELETGETEWTKSIRNQISRLTSLTEKLVFLSRMDEGDNTPVMVDFDFSGMVSDTAQVYTAVAQSKARDFEVRVEDGIILKGNEDNLRQAVSLLLDNAMKYSNDGGSITLSLKSYKKGKHRARLTVKNTVDDISTGSHDEMFERFYRADESRSSASGGHGIGLAVVRAIVEAHGGSIKAFSRDGKSIEFMAVL